MSDEQLLQAALDLLREDPTYLEDARRFAPIGNSIAGSILSLVRGAPRQYTEAAVCEALKIVTRKGKKGGAHE